MRAISTVPHHAIADAAAARATDLDFRVCDSIEDWWRRSATDEQLQLAQNAFRSCKSGWD